MTISVGNDNSFKDIGFKINTVIFSFENESIERNLSNSNLNLDSYVRRHYILSGSFSITYPDKKISSQTVKTGSIWPSERNITSSSFQVTSLEKNSSYICIKPYDYTKKIIHEINFLKQGQSFMTTAGCVYICTSNVKIWDGDYLSANSIIVCKNQPLLLHSTQDCNIIKFQSINGS